MNVFLLSLLFLSLTGNSFGFLEKFFGKVFSKNRCPIKLYNPKDSSFIGVKLYTNANTFHPLLQTLSTYAKQCHVKINVKRAFIQDNSAMSNIMLRDHSALAFRLGEAIKFEIFDQDNKLLCNQSCMKKNLSHLPDAKCFLEKLSRNSDFQQDPMKPTILMKRQKSNQSLDDKRKDLQNKCKKFDKF
jgi:hypothetical protein